MSSGECLLFDVLHDLFRMYLPLENVLMIWWLKKPNKTMASIQVRTDGAAA